MDPINGLNLIAKILRQKLSERSSSMASANADPQSSVHRGSSQRSEKASADEIKRRIGERLKAVSAEERRGRRGAQIFVEMVLLWEFGEQLIQDPQFTDLSREVVTTMVENPKSWEKLQALLGELFSSCK